MVSFTIIQLSCCNADAATDCLEVSGYGCVLINFLFSSFLRQGLELVIHLPQPPKCWDYRYPPDLINFLLKKRGSGWICLWIIICRPQF
jgi:hypothetical protein